MALEDQDREKTGRAGRRKRRRMAGVIAAATAGAAVLAFAIGFIRFAESVRASEGPPARVAADGIVVFTGGEDRVNGAVALLAEGAARRLLISGVHPHTTKATLAALSGGRDDLFRCCIDLDTSARDTIGNADETAGWARRNDFTSLIVVTSSYHMERSLTELARALPDVRLEGHPIATPSLELDLWWRSPQAARLLLGEYVKLLAARSHALIARGGARAGGTTAD